MKKFFTLCLGIAIAVSSYASHLMGGQISATHLSSDTAGSHYYLELDVYRDTLGIPMSLNQSVDVFVLDTSGNYSLLFSQSLTFGVGGPVSSMSSVYGVEVYHFVDTITFPANGYYMVKWNNCCRNGAIINMSSPLSESMSFLTYINVDSSSPNSSPTFLAPPVSYLPTNCISLLIAPTSTPFLYSSIANEATKLPTIFASQEISPVIESIEKSPVALE